MHLQNALRVATLLVLITPCTAYAQDKQHRLEINAGISSPGLHCRAEAARSSRTVTVKDCKNQKQYSYETERIIIPGNQGSYKRGLERVSSSIGTVCCYGHSHNAHTRDR